MAITLVVGGRKFSGWLDARVTTSMDTLAGEFSVSIALNAKTNLSILLRQPVKIFVDDVQVLDGFIEKINGNYDTNTDVIHFSGRDKTADIIDNQIGDQKEIKGTISFVALLKRILLDNAITDIEVINNVNDVADFSAADVISPEIGQNMFAFLNDYAGKRQVFLTTDGLGNIVINRDTTQQLKAAIIHRVGVRDANLQNNVISSEWSYDDTRRYNFYKVISQKNVSAGADNDLQTTTEEDVKNIVLKKGDAIDTEIRVNRVYVMKAEKPMEDKECQARAVWQLAIARARSLDYTAVINGHTADGEVWRPNRLVKVVDQRVGLDGVFLINAVVYNTDLDSGDTVEIGIVERNRYKLAAEEASFEKSTKGQGDKKNERVVATKEELARFNRLGDSLKGTGIVGDDGKKQ